MPSPLTEQSGLDPTPDSFATGGEAPPPTMGPMDMCPAPTTPEAIRDAAMIVASATLAGVELPDYVITDPSYEAVRAEAEKLVVRVRHLRGLEFYAAAERACFA